MAGLGVTIKIRPDNPLTISKSDVYLRFQMFMNRCSAFLYVYFSRIVKAIKVCNSFMNHSVAKACGEGMRYYQWGRLPWPIENYKMGRYHAIR